MLCIFLQSDADLNTASVGNNREPSLRMGSIKRRAKAQRIFHKLKTWEQSVSGSRSFRGAFDNLLYDAVSFSVVHVPGYALKRVV